MPADAIGVMWGWGTGLGGVGATITEGGGIGFSLITGCS